MGRAAEEGGEAEASIETGVTDPSSDYREYQTVLRAFLEGRTSAEGHSKRFFTLFQQDERMFPEPIYNALNRHQSACEAFTSDEALLRELPQWSLDEAELRQNAADALEAIRAS